MIEDEYIQQKLNELKSKTVMLGRSGDNYLEKTLYLESVFDITLTDNEILSLRDLPDSSLVYLIRHKLGEN